MPRRARLGPRQRAAFARDGYLVLRGVVGRPAIDAALQVANHWLGHGFDPTQRATYRAQTFAPEHVADPEIVGLLTQTEGLEIAESLVGQRIVPPETGQIALRFPAAPGEKPDLSRAHLDGIPTPVNGVPTDGQIHSFTLLAGVFLSDCPAGDHGNFTVWPGTHLETARWLRTHGTTVTDPDAFLDEIGRLATATSGPVALDVRAGDLVLAHFLLLHRVGPHQGPNIRYAVYFRLESERHADVARDSLTEPWLDWPAFNGTA